MDKTTLHADPVSEYSGQTNHGRSATVATYSIMTWRGRKDALFLHLRLFDERN